MSSTVLITGASTGIGYELAKLYAKDKFHVILVARGKEKLEQVAAELTKDYGCDTTVLACDLSEPKAAQQLYDQVKAKKKKSHHHTWPGKFTHGVFTQDLSPVYRQKSG